MTCCGSKRQQVVRNANLIPSLGPDAGASGNSSPVLLVYTGTAELVVVGASGRRYRFAERGARQSVEPRDAAALETIPWLRRASG